MLRPVPKPVEVHAIVRAVCRCHRPAAQMARARAHSLNQHEEGGQMRVLMTPLRSITFEEASGWAHAMARSSPTSRGKLTKESSSTLATKSARLWLAA